jgi:hypothetical protein
MVTYAAVVTFFVAIVYALLALVEFSNHVWIVTNGSANYDLFGSNYFWWGIFDAAIAVVAFFAAWSILRGGVFGFMMGLFGAGASLVRWLFYIPATPWLAITIIGIDLLVLYGLCTEANYFSGTA